MDMDTIWAWSKDGDIDPITGMAVNLTEVKHIVEREIIETFDHKNLNKDCQEFKYFVPTAENIAIVIWIKLAKTKLKPYLRAVVLYETPKNKVRYHPHQRLAQVDHNRR